MSYVFEYGLGLGDEGDTAICLMCELVNGVGYQFMGYFVQKWSYLRVVNS